MLGFHLGIHVWPQEEIHKLFAKVDLQVKPDMRFLMPGMRQLEQNASSKG